MGLTARKYWLRFAVVSLVVIAVWSVLGIRAHQFGIFVLTGLCTQVIYGGLNYANFQGRQNAERNINSIKDRD
jgi:hypothetical protein